MSSARQSLDWSAQSRRDLLQLEIYYAQFGQIIADRVIAAIGRAAKSIEYFPHSGRTWEKRQGIRLKPLKTYPLTLVYRIRRKDIQIIRVIEQHRRYFNR